MSNVSEPVQPTSVLQPPTFGDPASLVRFCANVLETLRLDDGIYCYDRAWAEPGLRGRSLRYTLMCALGFERASRSGYTVPAKAGDLLDLVLGEAAALTPGDVGLALWLASRLDDARAPQLAEQVGAFPAQRLAPLEGMEIGWLTSGAAAAVVAGAAKPALAEQMLATLRGRQSRRTPLFHHVGGGHGRAHLPNFATQIYSVLALADAGSALNDMNAVGLGRDLADLLVELRGDDCGWPWLFHSERGKVVERYQVYSVHQDAMAPMAFFALSDATGDLAYARAAAEGMAWCFGRNELDFMFYDVATGFAHRAIKRRGMADRAMLWTNTAAGLVGLPARADLGGVEVNTTCRPYHLGWIMEAWSGRERHIELVTAR